MIHPERLTARMEGEFVVFLIGMRINHPWRLHRWWPVLRAMPRMLKELRSRPELGLLHAEAWFSRTIILVQCWRSVEQLIAYASDREAAHLPAWRDFNRAVGTSGAVGIWHETYVIAPGRYETVYVNMPPFGLGKTGELRPATDAFRFASGRLKAGGR